jgi:hypothetical protein
MKHLTQTYTHSTIILLPEESPLVVSNLRKVQSLQNFCPMEFIKKGLIIIEMLKKCNVVVQEN